MLEWNPNLETGHRSVDEDHRQFIRMLRTLEVATAANGQDNHIRELIVALYHYAVGHFTREEAYMARVHCPGYERNCRAHREFVEKLVRWMQLISDGVAPESLATVIHNESSSWIESHILSVDCQLRGCSVPEA